MLSPEGRRRGGSDFHAAVHAARDVHAEERILEVGDGIDVRAQARGAGLGEQVASAERQNAVALRKPILEGDAVRVQPGGVHQVPYPHGAGGRDCPPAGRAPAVRRSGQERDPGRARVADQRRDDLRRIDALLGHHLTGSNPILRTRPSYNSVNRFPSGYKNRPGRLGPPH